VKAGELPKLKGEKLIAAAFEKGVITATEKDDLLLSEKLRWDAIQVDDFSQEDYATREKDKPTGTKRPHLKHA
jgi:acyl-CoA dehydrogenase